MLNQIDSDRLRLEEFFTQLQLPTDDPRAETVTKIHQLETPKHNGFSAITYLLKLQRGQTNHHWVVQIAPASDTGLFDDYDMQRSYQVQSDLGALNVPVAEMITYCNDTSWLGQCFFVMEFVPGKVPPDRPSYHSGGWLADSSSKLQREIWFAGIAGMGCLHAVDTAQFGYLFPKQQADNDALLTDAPNGELAKYELTQWRGFLAKLHDFGNDDLKCFSDTLSELEQSSPCIQPLSIGWGDAKPGNIIFDNNRVAAILDWELCGISTPQQDLSHWMAVDWFLSSGIGKTRLSALPSRNETLEHYQSVNEVDLNGIDWWFRFALVRMGLIFHRGNQRVPTREGNALPANPIIRHLPEIMRNKTWLGYAN